jgi:hypothetical protein
MIELAAVIAGAKSVGLDSLPSVLRAVSGYEDDQTRRLKRIESGVNALATADYRTGLEYLNSAARNEDNSVRRDYLNEGLRSLRKAAGVFEGAGDHKSGSSVAILLASVYSTIGPIPEANAWAERAYREAILAVREGVQEANERLDARIGRITLFSRVAMYGLLSLFALYVFGRLFAPHIVPMLTFAGGSILILSMLYLEARFHYRNLAAWFVRRKLQRWMIFIEETREVCAEILGPQSNLTEYVLIREEDIEGMAIAYRLVEKSH